MMVKSPDAEIALAERRAANGATWRIRYCRKYTEVGIGEVEVSQRASDEATLMMLETIGPIWRGNSAWFYRRRDGRLSRADRPERRHSACLDQQYQASRRAMFW